MGISGFFERGISLMEDLEEHQGSFRQFLLLFLCIVTLRNLIESFTSSGYIEQFGTYALHYPLAFMIAFLVLSIILALCAGESIIGVSKLMFFLWLLILLPPLADLIKTAATGRATEVVGWLDYGADGFWKTYLNLYNPFIELEGATTGIRIQSFLSCILATVYVVIKSKSAVRAVITPLLISFFSFCFFSLPHLFVAASSLITPEVIDARSMVLYEGSLIGNYTQRAATGFAVYQLILAIVLFMLWLLLYDPGKLRQFMKKILVRSTVLMILLAAFGFVIGWGMFLHDKDICTLICNHRDLASVLSVVLSLAGVAVFGASLSGLLPEITTPEKTGELPYDPRDIMTISLVVSLAFAAVVSYPVFMWVLALLILETVSRVPPFRLSVIPLLGPLVMSVKILVFCLIGFTLFSGNLAPSLFPVSIAIGILIMFFLAYLIRLPAPRVIFLLAYVFGLYFLWPVLPTLGGKVRHFPAELKHSIFATFLEHDGYGDLAAIEFGKAYDMGSKDPWIAFQLGYYSLAEGDREKTLQYYKQALELDPRYSKALNNTAVLLTDMGRYEEAGIFWKRLLSEGREVDPYLANIVTFFIDQGKAGEGLEALLKAESRLGTRAVKNEHLRLVNAMADEMDPTDLPRLLGETRVATMDAFGQLRAGLCLWKVGRYSEVPPYLDGVLKAIPSFTALYHIYGIVYQKLGRDRLAVDAYERFLDDYPMNLEASVNIAASYLNIGDLESSLAVLEKLEKEYPGEPRVMVNLANTYIRNGEFEEAENILESLLAAGETSPLVHYNLGVLLEKQDRGQEAIRHYEEAIQAGFSTPTLFTRVGEYYESAGNKERAAQMYSRAVQIDSSFVPARTRLRRLLEGTGPSNSAGTSGTP